MVRFCSLYSGSSGNCAYAAHEGGGVLIDAGVSLRSIGKGLRSVGADLPQVRAVFLTHEHSDHIRALPMVFKKLSVPVYATPGTIRGVCAALPALAPEQFTVLETGCTAEAAGMAVTSFATSHDSLESVGYRISPPDGGDIAVATDLGFVDEGVLRGLQGCEVVMLESNHDIELLRNGSYPAYLKRRILSASGHLSNRDCAAVLPALAASGTRHVVLAHLSSENNAPALAVEAAQRALQEACASVSVEAAPRCEPGRVYCL